MPISEAYVVQYLLQTSLPPGRELQWYEKESDGFEAKWHGLLLDLESIPSRAGALLQLTLIFDLEKIFIGEPRRCGVFNQKYSSAEDQRLAGLLGELWDACTRQCELRKNRPPVEEQRIRQLAFQRVIETPDALHADPAQQTLVGIGEEH